MKKLISFLMATVLCVGMSTVVMATESEDTGNVTPEYLAVAPEITTVIDGQQVTLVSNQLTTEYTADELLVLMDNATHVFDPEEYTLTFLAKPTDYSLPAGVTMPTGGITITLTFEDSNGNPVLMSSEEYYYVIHEKVEGQGVVETFCVRGNADGSLTISGVYSLSPFYVGTLEEVNAPGGNGGGNGGNGGGTGNNGGNNGNGAGNAGATSGNNSSYYYEEEVSPKTADTGYMVAMMAMVAFAGVVVVTRKVNVNR